MVGQATWSLMNPGPRAVLPGVTREFDVWYGSAHKTAQRPPWCAWWHPGRMWPRTWAGRVRPRQVWVCLLPVPQWHK